MGAAAKYVRKNRFVAAIGAADQHIPALKEFPAVDPERDFFVDVKYQILDADQHGFFLLSVFPHVVPQHDADFLNGVVADLPIDAVQLLVFDGVIYITHALADHIGVNV